MAAIDFAAIARQSSAEFADSLGSFVRGSWETEWNTEDDFVAERTEDDEVELGTLLQEPCAPKPEAPKGPKPGGIIDTHWGPLEPSEENNPIPAKHW
jgi:hypothetical protein